MATIAENLGEKVKEQLNYEEKTWQIPQRLFKNLVSICIVHGIEIVQKNGRVQKVKIELTKGSESIGEFYAKPFVKNERLMLSFKHPKKMLIDAAHAFGEDVQRL
jgi:hypothetical protein